MNDAAHAVTVKVKKHKGIPVQTHEIFKQQYRVMALRLNAVSASFMKRRNELKSA
jgi:hypothetical protein